MKNLHSRCMSNPNASKHQFLYFIASSQPMNYVHWTPSLTMNTIGRNLPKELIISLVAVADILNRLLINKNLWPYWTGILSSLNIMNWIGRIGTITNFTEGNGIGYLQFLSVKTNHQCVAIKIQKQVGRHHRKRRPTDNSAKSKASPVASTLSTSSVILGITWILNHKG